MRRFIPVLLATGLSGCTGFGEFMDHTFTNPGRNPNISMADSENVRLIRGLDPAIQPLDVEPGNIWPKFDTRDLTLADIANNAAREDARGFEPTTVSGGRPGLPAHKQSAPTRGASTPLSQVQPDHARIPDPSLSSPLPIANALRRPDGVVNAPNKPALDLGTTNGYPAFNTPPDAGAIVVPNGNGNGTSTVINSNGSIQTIPTSR